MSRRTVIVTGPFDTLQSQELRWLDEASQLGSVKLFLWSDELILRHLGRPAHFPLVERNYFFRAVRFVTQVDSLKDLAEPDRLPRPILDEAGFWVDVEGPTDQ